MIDKLIDYAYILYTVWQAHKSRLYLIWSQGGNLPNVITFFSVGFFLKHCGIRIQQARQTGTLCGFLGYKEWRGVYLYKYKEVVHA